MYFNIHYSSILKIPVILKYILKFQVDVSERTLNFQLLFTS